MENLRARRVLFASLLLAACGVPAPAPETTEPRHLVLITVDTWRADHFLKERAGVFLTPSLAQLAARALHFPNASSPATETSAGVAAILTGLLPERSGVVVNAHTLPQLLPTLTTVLGDAGYRSGAFVANPVLAPGVGFERGFEHYDHVRRPAHRAKARADTVNRRALAWLDSLAPQDRIFLWLHYMEPHGPYHPPIDRSKPIFKQAGVAFLVSQPASESRRLSER